MKKRTVAILSIHVAAVSLLFGQHLPEGTYHPNRERTYDIIHYKADLKIDWTKKQVVGEATVKFHPLGSLSSISLDSYWLNVSSVKEQETGKALKYASGNSSLTIEMGRTIRPADTATVLIQYSATPTAGLYFIDASPGTNNQPAIFTYGEGGIHANWLPIYNENNDKFSSEMSVTVNKPHVAISNGKLLETTENRDGTRTFHWYQSLPHSNYLIALFVGEYVPVQLRSAFGEIPLSVWVHPGQEEIAGTVFQRTPEMVEFFSNKFNYRYPWDKYDQISAYDYAIGAMENTGITGHNDRILRKPGQLEEFNPEFETVSENWTAETLISHELAHHWFGDNLTCRNLANIWVNESFASYCMMLWDEHRLGTEYFRSQRWIALQAYLKFVSKEHVIRPLEYRYFDSRTDIYNTETTYQKGAIVLHMLRWILGNDSFFKALGYYMNKHQFSNVESEDFKFAIEEATGQNLEWFFQQWVWGGGHPVFEVSHRYLSGRKKVEVTVNQVQPIVEGQGLFTLPVEIRIDSGGKTERKTVWVQHTTDHFTFDASGEPDMVSFDGRGALVADIRAEKGLNELIYQLEHDDYAGRMRAIRQLSAEHAMNPAMFEAFRRLLGMEAHWSLRAEALLQLANNQSNAAQQLLLDQLASNEYQIRRAVVLALGSRFTDASRAALRRVIDKDKNDVVAAAALVSLAKIEPSLSSDFFKTQLSRSSWYDCVPIAAIKAMEILAGQSVPQKSQFVPLIRERVSSRFNYELRQTALRAWSACTPTDPQLFDRLTTTAKNDILPVRTTAIELLAELKMERALPVLEEIIRTNGDSDIRKAAQDAMEEIARVGSK